jgi:hypothetical protein
MKQITILSHDREDLIGDITQILCDAQINLESVTARNFGAQSIATITTDSHDNAMQALQNVPDLQVVSEDALIVRVKDEMGALAKLARRFTDAHIYIRSLRFVERHQGYALVAISTEHSDKAREIVGDILVS